MFRHPARPGHEVAPRRSAGQFCRVSASTDVARPSLEALLLPVLDRAYSYALRLVRNRADAEDLVQEAALAAARGFSGFEQGTNFGAWYFRILTNCFYARHRRRETTADADLDEIPDLYLYERAADLGLHGTSPDPAGELLASIDRDQIDEALVSLPNEYRVVAALYFVQDFSYAEIADVVNVPVGTVRSRLHRARKLLQLRLWNVAREHGLVRGAPEGSP